MINIKSFSHTFKHIGWKTLLLVMALSLLFYTIALAASGDLDPTFSGDGKLTTDIGGWKDRANAVAVQSDGRIVAVGDHYNAAGDKYDFAVVRYRSGGALDNTFSGDGKLTTNFGGKDQAKDVAIQSNGRIVVAGHACDASWFCDLGVARYNSNGSLDTTFSGDGRVTVDFGDLNNGAGNHGLAIQTDGKIVIAGFMDNGSDYDFAVYRLNPNGSLDPTFHGDGKLNFGFGSGRYDIGMDLAIQSNGKMVVVGETCDAGASNCNFAIARVNADGILDTTFSGDGKTVTNFGADDHGFAVAIQSNGRIVAAGTSDGPSDDYFAVARYTSNGNLDASFHADGKVLTNLSPGLSNGGRDLAIQSDGKILVAGYAYGPISLEFGLIRYNANGSLDNTFDVDGKLTTNFGGDDYGTAIALQGDGRIIVAGKAYTGADWDFALVRYLP